MNRRRMLINAARQIVHNGVTLPDLPTGANPAAIIWDKLSEEYRCIEQRDINTMKMSYSDTTMFNLWWTNTSGSYYYYTLSAPYETWSARTQSDFTGQATGNVYGGAFYRFTCYSLEHILYACQNVYDNDINSTATWLRDADTQTFDQLNGSFPEREYTWETIGTTLHIYDDFAMCDYATPERQPWYSIKSGITSIEIHDGVTRVGNNAFVGFSALTSFNYANSVTTFGVRALASTSLTTVVFNEGTTTLGAYMIEMSPNLISITIPVSVTSIPTYFIQSCGTLTSINYNGTMAQWNALSKGYRWNRYTGAYTIHCTDGDLPKT